MDALSLLQTARRAGLMFQLEDGRLLVRGPADAAPIVRMIAAAKPEIISVLETIGERSAIMEFDGGASRADAEAAAWREAIE